MLEILAPAGNASAANAAINNGADAIYLGYSAFSARQSAENFDLEGLKETVVKARFCGVKVYVAMNTVVKDEEVDSFMKTLLTVWGIGVDAIILQDVFLGKRIKQSYPQIVLHLSTQAGICNENGARLAKEYGFSRVILARETPLSEIKKISSVIETEAFVQGALCTCFSGQCYFSSFAGGNSGNRGRCKQPCRKRYVYDRLNGKEYSYALSLSDLSVGESIEKLIEAGVTSFKIEGRMRRAEYVAAAVRYYRAILDGTGDVGKALSDLKRTYNRGNYTKGLAFGQDKRFLSPSVQGHIGEKVGVVKVTNGKFFVESIFKPRTGDAFKILREGKEVCGAVFQSNEKRGFTISSKIRLKNGDGVFITTDTEVNERVLLAQKKGSVHIVLSFKENEPAQIEGEGICICSDYPLQSATTRALTVDELKACFSKTDGLPVEIVFDKIEIAGNVFIAKSQLNALRREYFTTLIKSKALQNRTEYEYSPFCISERSGKNSKTAVIGDEFEGVQADIAIYKPQKYAFPLPESFKCGKFEKYIYYPPLCTSEDEEEILARLSECHIDGIYAENLGAIPFARLNNLKIFAGTDLNLFNCVSIDTLLTDESVAYYAISKETNESEQKRLVSDKAFALSFGNIKIMNLCYCPFGKTCNVCDKRTSYTLTDENGRVFPVRRYESGNGACRFEIYNCADLIGTGAVGAGQLLDLTLFKDKPKAIATKDNAERQKEITTNHTSGHFKRGVL